MFPNTNITTTTNTEPSQYSGKVFKFNFEKNEYVVQNGKLVELSLIDSLKQFVKWTLKTQVEKYKIYTDDYGIDTDFFIGQKSLPIGFVNSEFKRQIEEQLIKHDSIDRIEDFKVSRSSNYLNVEFIVITNLGESLTISEVI